VRGLTVQILSSGALVDVSVGLSDARRRVMQRQGRQVPPAVAARLIIDTGASTSLLDEGLMRSLQLTPTGATSYHSSSTNGIAQNCDVYDVALFLGGMGKPHSLRFDPVPVMATPFINQPFEGLLGRDVLNRIHLVWKGPAGTLVLEYP
jgi:hypothetical protein